MNNIKNNNYNLHSKEGWDKVWELKGLNTNNNIFELNGYDDTDFDPINTFEDIIKVLGIQKGNKVLEIGCGAGLFTQLFQTNYDYYGIDYSRSLINKNIKLNNSLVYNCEASNTPFKDKYFDYGVSISVFEYFPNKEYTKQVIEEMERVCIKGIYILNIRNKTHTSKLNKHKLDGPTTHTLHSRCDFEDFEILESLYENDKRFSIFKKLI
tara:strand:- start:336 stop:965 length:630 start_codon:yes stop_codon:yes gene_type:complete